ncbi:N-acetylmuramic acid/N-acetylglucosamine kinase [Cohnella xylanilytica]|uniref:ATPase n=1 Tax=Cohnella xylanilytica TaxID=557555 RepID=A0A841U4E0_9BACL|nr:BadF/BadG/BcrA/BcrD ATPase family protein [Cohnella xylanilytica]MBB6694639.1 ATPase [Cohnella xylanilytica]GIO14278.1 N-acetylmuramic acid/N-acetylglucosamine kinase [Cohnella xylanilytica]
MKYVAGLDGGGTKTAVAVADGAGRIVRTFESGAINYNGRDEESVRTSLREMMAAIADICGGLANCGHVCIGAAGVSNPTVAARLTAEVRASGFEGGLTITGDQETALQGALDSPFGAVLIAGTGSICYGRNEAGETHRAGGGGHLLDDGGSGYAIGRDLLAAVLQASDGRIPPTAIAELVYRRLQADSVRQLIGFVYDPSTSKRDIAALAPLLSEACEAGDRAALAIAEASARALFALVVPVVGRLRLQDGSLALAGSVLRNNAHVRNGLLGLLAESYPKLRTVVAAPDAASLGAVRIALQESGPQGS